MAPYLDAMDKWARAVLVKAFFLRGYEGAFTASDYDNLEDDERDLLLAYIRELKNIEAEQHEEMKQQAQKR
jgi:hypothetical protein